MSELPRDIIQSNEIELYIQNMSPSKIEELGSPLWFESHHRLQKLSQQSSVEATEMREESVKDLLISHGKVPVLIHEAICIQVWREKVFRQIIQQNRQPKNTFIGYIILYHEVTAISLLQNILYHKDSTQNIEDTVLDLIDYCAAEIVRLLSQDKAEMDKLSSEVTNLEELEIQCETIGFNIGLAAICILRYLIEYMDELSLSAISRLYTTHDIPLLMANLIQVAPWKRMNPRTNIIQTYDEGSWKNSQKVPGVSKYEGQCWIALRCLLLDPKCLSHYEINDFRQQNLVKIQKHLHESIIDQISPLIQLKQFLAHLTMSTLPSQTKRPLIMETIPEIKSKILSEGFKRWKKIAAKHIAIIFDSKKEAALEVARRLGETYDLDHLERLAPEGPVCSACGDAAAKRCSKCKSEWYCGRECQVKRWPKHKASCTLISEKASMEDDQKKSE